MVTQSTRLVCRVVTVGLGFLLLIGCQQKLGGNLSRDAKQLERAFALTSTSPQAGDPSTYKTADTAALVKTLTIALHSGDLDTASKTLHTLNFRSAGLSFDQFSAIRQTFGDVSARLAQRADKGDQQAKDLMDKMSP